MTAPPPEPRNEMREKILAAGRRAVQAQGYNALSFRDLAAEVGIKSASVHYHFPTKGDLGAELARRYTQDGAAYLAGLLAQYKAQSRNYGATMKKYTDIFRTVLQDDNRMCLYGIMSAESEDLPVQVRAELARFNEANISWLADLLVLAGEEPKKGKGTQRRAQAMFAAIEGAQLIARGRGEVAVYDEIIEGYRACGLLP